MNNETLMVRGSEITVEQINILLDSAPAGSLQWTCKVALAHDCNCRICLQVLREARETCAKAWNARCVRLEQASFRSER
jgi:hypothetical protein